MKFLAVFVVFLLLASFCFVGAQTTPDTVNMEISSTTWNKSTLRILIVEAPNESWWQTEFLNASIYAVENWKAAIDFFADKYPDYAYLSSLTFDVDVSQQTAEGYDVYVDYAETIPQQNQMVLGRTTTYPTAENNIDHCTITLATTSQTLSFNPDGMMNVAAHEFGHALGLGHSNSSSDLMYPSNDLIFSENQVSTLNLYGVAVLFNWLNQGSPPTPQTNTITLPSSIPFEYAPVAHRSSSPQADAFNFFLAAADFVEQNIVALLIGIGVICLLVALMVKQFPVRSLVGERPIALIIRAHFSIISKS